MRIDPELLAFARDSSAVAGAQGRIHAAKAFWQRRPEVSRVLSDCITWDRGAAFHSCAHLSALMAGEGAEEWARSWFADMVAACGDAPLAQIPFRHSRADGVSAIQLLRAGHVTLSMMMIDSKEGASPLTISFTDCERYEAILAGEGEACAYEFKDSAPPACQSFVLSPGVRFAGDIRRSRAIVAVETPLVFLRVAREPRHPRLTREVDIATGRIVHRASACPSESRAELAAALLGAMGREDAAQALAAYACGQAGEGARWQALRHAIALDTAAGFESLCRIAEGAEDPLSSQAKSLREGLYTTYPQLANIRDELCRAS